MKNDFLNLNLSQMNIVEQITKAITDNGGIAEDISFATKKMITQFGKKLAEKGIKSRTPNPAFNVLPINTVVGIAKHFFWMYNGISPTTCPIKQVPYESKIIELIKLTPGQSTEQCLQEIDKLGFEPAPTNYVLGLGVQHHDAQKEYKHIVSLDKNNIFPRKDGCRCFLCLIWYSGRQLSMAREMGDWDDAWWFAVVPKDTLKS